MWPHCRRDGSDEWQSTRRVWPGRRGPRGEEGGGYRQARTRSHVGSADLNAGPQDRGGGLTDGAHGGFRGRGPGGRGMLVGVGSKHWPSGGRGPHVRKGAWHVGSMAGERAVLTF